MNAGDILTINDDKFYIISAVNSNTSLTLDKNYAETSGSGKSYRILLNTAAHFPSDTAAKVERALEQLSDINEAAINNDRTVTAATRINGKGIESTTGYINLNPPNVNSNTGGSLRFYYNQSSSPTSKIFEDASGRIRIDADLYFAKYLEGPLNKRTTNINRGTFTDGAKNHYIVRNYDNSDKIVSSLYEEYKYNSASDYNNAVGLYVYDPTENTSAGSKARIQVGYNQDGAWTYAPTPPVDSNTTNIATTAWVNNYIIRGWTVLNGSAVDMPTSSRTNAISVTFPSAGLYLVQYELSFGSNATGYRHLTVGTSATGSSSDRFGAVLVPAASGTQTILQLTRMERIYDSTTTYYLNGYQNSGSTLSVGNGIRYTRIGEQV